MKDFKKTAVIIACVVLLCGQTVKAVAIPMLPYVPPTSGTIIDYIFNSYGVTSLQETSEALKFEKYMNLYRAVLGSAFDNFYADLTEVIDNSKTSRKIVLSQSMRDALRLGIKQSINEGIVIEAQESVESKQALADWINSDATPFEGMTTELLDYGDIWQKYGQNTIYALLKGASSGYLYVFACEPKTKGIKIRMEGGRAYYEPIGATGKVWKALYAMNGNNVDYIWTVSESTIPDSGAFVQPILSEVYNINLPATTQIMEAQNTAVQQAINDDVAEIATPVMIMYPDGTIDLSYPTIIALPAEDVAPATNIADLPIVQERLGVLPTTSEEDVEEIKQQLEEQQAIKYGNTGEYAVDLTTYFPFCIPFDLVRIITALDAEPEAPHITFPMPSDVEDGKVVFTEYEFSLDWMSPVMVWVRRGELILGGIGIMLATRNIIRG